MRSAIIVSLSLCVGITGISFAASRVDLDEPGAMAALARDRPAHYTFLSPSAPAKKRISVVMDGIEYRATVLMTKDPGKLEKVK